MVNTFIVTWQLLKLNAGLQGLIVDELEKPAMKCYFVWL